VAARGPARFFDPDDDDQRRIARSLAVDLSAAADQPGAPGTNPARTRQVARGAVVGQMNANATATVAAVKASEMAISAQRLA
jgi:hypothetical protein